MSQLIGFGAFYGSKKIGTLNKTLIKLINMKKTENGMPTANIAINKSRLKIYKGDTPTYYLKKGQEFQIELFNPTKDTILGKIFLNSKAIAQGGLVLRPGERVFLERYIDVAKKFKFDTYEVSGNNNEVKKAIEDNGDFKVQFYTEIKRNPILRVEPTYIRYNTNTLGNTTLGNNFTDLTRGNNLQTNYTDTSGQGYQGNITFTTNSVDTNSFYNAEASTATMDWMQPDMEVTNISNTLDIEPTSNTRSFGKKKSRSKKIETGRVEEGSTSDQEMTYVNKDWSFLPFHTVEYKLLPLSQKVNTSEDVNVKTYCTSCGKKVNKGDNYCGKCGNKI